MNIYKIGLDFVAANSEVDFLKYAEEIYGDSFIEEHGYVVLDKDINISWVINNQKNISMKDIFENYMLANVTTPHLVYTFEGQS
jgi:hypothetical protein